MDTLLSLKQAASAVLFLSLTAGFAHAAAAQAPAVGFTSNAYGAEDNASDTGAGSYSLGFEFTANSTDFVTALGYFNDPSFNPSVPFNSVSLSPTPFGTYTYADTHQVGLYQVIPSVGTLTESGLLLASATVSSMSAPNGDFLYTTLTLPVPLVSGDSYVLAGVTGGGDPYIYNVEDNSQPGGVGLTVDPAISYDEDRYDNSSSLSFPSSTDSGSEPGFLGPNLQLSPTVSAAPEPSEWAAMAFSALGVGALLLRARRRARMSAERDF